MKCLLSVTRNKTQSSMNDKEHYSWNQMERNEVEYLKRNADYIIDKNLWFVSQSGNG